MKLLLDTHTFLWAIDDPKKLSARARKAIEDEHNDLVLSVASLWEIILKVETGKLRMQPTAEYFQAHCQNLGVSAVLAIQPGHIYCLRSLPTFHSDPFDRLLIAQAKTERLRLVSRDDVMESYLPDVIW